jgi:hypothetical protein
MAKIVALPNGYLLQKQDDNAWWIYRYRESGESNTKLPLKIVSGSGGSIDYEIEKFAEAMRAVHAQLFRRCRRAKSLFIARSLANDV